MDDQSEGLQADLMGVGCEELAEKPEKSQIGSQNLALRNLEIMS